MSVRVAAVQDCPVLLDRAATLDLVAELTDKAVAEGAQLVVFPEAFVPGPPVWIDALPVWEDADWHTLLMREAVTVPGDACDRLAEIASSAGVVLVVGVDEREQHGGTIYNTVLTFGRDGSLLGRHRKLMPTGGERLVWGMGDGSDLRVLDTPTGRLASLICWENYMPLARFHLYAQGPQIWIAPTLATAEFWVATMRHIARESVCFTIGAAPVMHPDWLPEGLPNTNPLREWADKVHGGWTLTGYSVIVDPFGKVLAGPLVNERGILLADLDFDLIAARKRMFDATGHYNRPDVFRLEVDDRRKLQVTTTSLKADAPGRPMTIEEPVQASSTRSPTAPVDGDAASAR
ncbi:MAG: carbon-nitrogen hydrolase family protein [Solirubrobacterales bacterium]|nr:carbon-nitrogen hydrolase family protein [Solirubrobacterales bacterium]